MNNPTILIVDDDKDILKIIEEYLVQAHYQVITAGSGSTALHLLRTQNPSLLVLDLMLPDKDGWEITKIIRADAQIASIPIIMVTARIEDSDKIIGLELGADDYLTKPFNPRELVARVRALLRRSQKDAPSAHIITSNDLHLNIDTHQFLRDDVEIALTPTEFKLLHKLMENPRHTFTREELLEYAVGYGYEGLSRTLDSHIRNLRKKIGDQCKIETVYGIGYRFTQ